MKQLYGFLAASLLSFTALPVFGQSFNDGVFILNEGGAGSNNASVSFLSNTGNLQNNIYATVNPTVGALGDTAQNMAIHGDYAYIVLNISNTIKIVNSQTFLHVATINTGLNNPRYMAFSNGKAYVTNWGSGGSTTDDYVAVINLSTNTIETNIALAEGVERILEINGKIYVAHQGGYGYGNTVSVIDPTSNTLERTIQVGDVPNSMVEKDGILYVLCGGKPSWAGTETFGALVKINTETQTIIGQVDFPQKHPSNLKIDGSNVYYSINADVFKASIANTAVPATPFFTLPPQNQYGIYGMEVINNKIYVGDAVNYVSDGKVYVYTTTDGTLSNTYTVGKLPNGFVKAVDSNLGTGEHTKQNIVLYPNPATDYLYVNTDKQATVKMYDMAGRLIKNQSYTTSGVGISELNPGMYVVEITIDNATSVQKIIKR
jgi:YVTN family beta-propeller protein